jgi:hypothetical protein|tara:strand:- start:1845 stop:2159 length:315 start_codon:yes stop_codon:yes gene_type:complete
MADKKENKQVSIELPEELAQGFYSNLAVVNHSPTEFVVDFISMMPGMPKAKVKSRVILTPQHAKRLLVALADNVKKYESQYGAIKDAGKQQQVPLTFGGPKAEA